MFLLLSATCALAGSDVWRSSTHGGCNAWLQPYKCVPCCNIAEIGTSSSVSFVALMGTASAPLGSSRRAISPREGVKMTPPHQILAATPQSEGLDATPSKTIHTTIKQNLNAAVPVRTRTPSRSKPRYPHTQHKPRRYSPTTSSDSLLAFRAPSLSTINPHKCRRTTCRRARSTKTSWRLRSRRAAWALRSLYGPFSLHHYL